MLNIQEKINFLYQVTIQIRKKSIEKEKQTTYEKQNFLSHSSTIIESDRISISVGVWRSDLLYQGLLDLNGFGIIT